MSRLRRASSLRRARASSGDDRSLLRASSAAPVFVSGSEHHIPRSDLAATSSSSSSSSSSVGSTVETLSRSSSSSVNSSSARLRALLRKISAPIIQVPSAVSDEHKIDAKPTPVSRQGSPRRTKSPRPPKMGRARSNSLSHAIERFTTSGTHTIVIYCANVAEMLITGQAPAFLIVDDRHIDDDMRAALDRAFDCQFAKQPETGEPSVSGDEAALKAEATYLCDADARLPQGAAYTHRRLRDEESGASVRDKERTHKKFMAASGVLAKTRVMEGHVRPRVKHLNVTHVYFLTHPQQ